MDFSEWEKYYEQILLDFGFERSKDEEAAGVLAGLTTGMSLAGVEDLRQHLADKEVFVFGNGPSLEEALKGRSFGGTLVAADGATTALMARGLVPHIIVTDLDGRVEDQLAANERGAIVVVLAHGDNIAALREWVPRFTGRIVATSQSAPVKHLLSFGGFTDGDRAVFLADHFGARRIVLVGFDFGSDRSPYSMDDEEMDLSDRGRVKMRKLTWANVLIAMLDNPAISFLS
ncbi:MAG: 6-hydroxymethylpterin diphosphokinase MptE-like protein [Thermoplasmatota archaeon]